MKEALKLALEAMQRIDGFLIRRGYSGLTPQEEEVIAAIEAALAQPAQQEPIGWMNPHGGFLSARYINEFASGIDKEIHNIPLYTAPQPEERNFCSRCGKRTADLTVIHTCTPPQDNA